MDNKKILLIGGGIVALTVGYLFLMKNRNKNKGTTKNGTCNCVMAPCTCEENNTPPPNIPATRCFRSGNQTGWPSGCFVTDECTKKAKEQGYNAGVFNSLQGICEFG